MDDLISRKAAKLKVARVVWEKGDTAEDFNDKCVDCLDDVQPEEAIPVAYIEEEIAILKAKGNELAPMLMSAILSSELDNWKERLKNDNS